jgi:CHAT domain-containing protein/tetratricopeptide (TPR) repeat protein
MVVLQAIAMGLWLLSASAAASEETSQVFEQAEKFAWRQNWAKARPLYLQAAEEFEANGKEREAIAARLGLILSRMYTVSSKLLLDELAEESRRSLVAQDADLQLRYLAAKAYLEEQPNLLAARQAWTQVLEIARRLGNREWESRASGHLGTLLWVIDIDSAGATRRVGQALVDAIKTSDLSAQVWFQEEVGEVMCLMKRYEAAMNFYQKALVSSSLGKDCTFPLDVYLGNARGLIQMGKPREALPLIERAEQEATAVGDQNAFAEGLILRARIVSTEDTAQATSLLDTAIGLSETNEFRRTLADALEEMAALQRLLGNDEKSKLYQTQCIEVTKSRHDGYSLPERYSRLAEVQIKQGNTAEASALYEQITDITEGLLINSPSPYAKASLINWLSDIFINHFKLALSQLKDPRQAFTILERARGRTVAEAIRGRLIDPETENSGLSVENEEISGLNATLVAAKSVVERKKLLDRLFAAEQRMAPVVAQQNLYFRKVVPRPVSIEELQSVLKPKEMILDYVLSEPVSYCLRITQEEIVMTELMAQSALDTLIDEYLFEIRRKGNAASAAKQLYSALLRGVEDLPQESLTDPEGKLLIDSHTVAYVQSATVHHLLRTLSPHSAGGKPRLLAVGDVPYEGDPGRTIKRGVLFLEGAVLPRLPATASEVNSLASLFPGEVVLLTGRAATEESLKSQHPLNRFQVLHFAVHGYADSAFPERSALVLKTGRASKEDGLFQDREIINLQLSAELVTLSACDSGFGKLQGQEGLSSLVKGFMFAGARTVVGSLWNLDDKLSTELMRRFYLSLVGGETKGTALRNAKLALMKEHGSLSPYYWAGFTLWGDSVGRIAPVN